MEKLAFELPAAQNVTPFCLRAVLLQSGVRAGGCLNKGSCDRHGPLQEKRKGKRCGLQGQESNAVDGNVMNAAARQ